jgi:large subunit ribosomal protein L9
MFQHNRQGTSPCWCDDTSIAPNLESKDSMKAIELLLTENVDNLGIVGDVVKVRPGYARNFLLPRLLATKPTPGAVKRLAERRKIVEAELKARRSVLEAVFDKLKTVEITMQRSANEQGVLFGGVSQHEIAEALRAEGFAIEDRMVRIGQVIKRLDTYPIPVVLASDLKAEIKLWVVSDKPLDQEAQQEQQQQQDEPAQSQQPADEASAEDGGKKKKKSRKSKGEEPAAEKA